MVTINAACSKSNDEPTGVEKEISWIIGAATMPEGFYEVPVSTTGMASLEITDYSICPSEALQVTVSSDLGAFILNRKPDANVTYELETPPGSEFLRIEPSMLPHRLAVSCVTEGSAVITYRYVN